MNNILGVVSVVGLLCLSSCSSIGVQPAVQESRNYPAMTSDTTGEAHSFAEYKAIAAALQLYINVAKTGDGDRMRTVFYDHAHVVGSTNGEFHNVDADAFRDSVNGSKSPDVKHHIAWIDISGPAAAAKVEFINWGGFRFTDFFVLYKQDGKWRISGKVYDSHSKN